ncbi:MAG: prolyl oligopeptidase family serine peptidase [Planctomycetota bacterium]|nr:prolyl oligopeptidase family serine peptidase [Planctomycetota bacterium]
MNGERAAAALLIAAASIAVAFPTAAVHAAAGGERPDSGAVSGEGSAGGRQTVRMRLGREGCVTGWLVCGPASGPRAAAEKTAAGAIPAAGADGPAGPWRLHLSDSPVVGRGAFPSGPVSGWCCAAAIVSSKAGGRRLITAGGCGTTIVYVGGRKVLEVPVQYERWMDIRTARVELPAGETPLYVFAEPRYGKIGFFVGIAGTDGRPAADTILLPADEGAAARPERLLPSCMRVSIGSTVLRPGSQIRGTVSLEAGCVDVDGGIAASVSLIASHDGPPLREERLDARPLAELPARPWRFAIETGEALPATSLLRIRFRLNGSDVGFCDLRIYNPQACLEAAAAMEQLAVYEERRLRLDLPLARLKAEKARLWAERMMEAGEFPGSEAGEQWEAAIEEAEAALTQARVGRQPLAGRKGFIERAYTSSIDGSAQPYLVYVPESCDPAKARDGTGYPLVVYLHGYVPSYDKHKWVDRMPEFEAAIGAAGAIMAVPFGRGNTDFVSIGEEDVLDVIAEMKRLYPVDPSRVYLYGYSMGGTGAYTLAGHYPGRFAASVVIAGRTDYYRWRNLRREDVHPFKRWLIEQDNPLDLAENIASTPALVYQATGDSIIPPEQPKLLADRLAAIGAGAAMELRTFEGDHWTGFDILGTREPLDWLMRRRLAPMRKQTAKAHSPKYARGPLAGVETVENWLSDATVTAEWTGGTLTVSSVRNVAAFSLFDQDGLSAVRAWMSGSVRMPGIAAGTFEAAAPDAASGRLLFCRKETARPALAKTARLAGPIREVFCRPFAVIRGTGGDDAARVRVDAAVRAFARDWRAFAKGTPRIFDDSGVLADPRPVESMNWVLFGTPATNQVLARLAPKLPIRFDETEADVNGRRVSLAGRGLAFCYPDPDRPGTMVAVFCGHPYGGHMSFNHKWDFLPDFIVFTPERDTDDTNRPVVAGYFDPAWRFSESMIWWFADR